MRRAPSGEGDPVNSRLTLRVLGEDLPARLEGLGACLSRGVVLDDFEADADSGLAALGSEEEDSGADTLRRLEEEEEEDSGMECTLPG